MRIVSSAALAAALAMLLAAPAPAAKRDSSLWKAYDNTLSKASYVDLTHRITPDIPVWKGFGSSTFEPAVNPETNQPYNFAKDGFEATAYHLATDQLGTQLDPPAHWDPNYPSIDELPASYAVRPLVVINTAPQVRKDPKYFLHTPGVKAWERKHGRIPEGSVVFVRSDWSKGWTEDPAKAKELAADPNFPSVGLDALKFLHHKRHILFHGHEPLDTDSTPTLEGEAWLMHHGYAQAEGVDNLDAVPATGCLVSIGYPKFAGGVGGYARFVAICPPSVKGRKVSRKDAPLPRTDATLHWDQARGFRVR